MNVNEAMDAIYEYALAWQQHGKTNAYRAAYLAAVEFIRSLESAHRWLRHEGGEMPEGVGELDIVAVMYEVDRQIVGGFAGDRNWVVPLWYYVVPAPPAPPKKERWRAAKGGAYWTLGINGEAVGFHDERYTWDDLAYEFGNYFRTREDAEAARPAILAAFKQVNQPTQEEQR